MAKKKEVPADPFVPAEEQPYPIPENWCWVTIGAIASVKGGKRIPKGNKLVEYKTEHPYIRVTDFDNRSIAMEQVKYIDEETFKLIRNYTISTQDVYISIAGTIGKVGIIPDDLDGANLTENAAKITNMRGIEKNFLLWLLESEIAQSQMRDSTISTTQPKLALFRIENVKFPLTPLAEQHRIVSRIESLFAKLDEAKEKAQAVVDGFELRKSAILHKAFTGELTERWRKEHGVELESWAYTTLGEIASFHQGVQIPVDEQFEEIRPDRIRFIRIVDYTQAGQIPRYVSINKIRKEANVSGQEIVMVRYGATAGLACDGICGLIANNLFVIDVDDSIRNYVKLYLKSPQIYKVLNTCGGSTAMPALNFKTVSSIKIPLPSVKEQCIIIQILNNFLAKEQQAKSAVEAVLDRIDTMKTAILARAFRGELGTNDPTEEWAGSLAISLRED